MSPPPTAFDTLRQLGSAVGPNVVVDVGYNDDSNDYRQGMIRVLALLGRKGVHHVVWLTLREHWHDYITINDEIRAVARTRPWVTVADWNRYSRSHPDWYQSDGIHLEAAGAAALAVFVHRTLARLRLTGAPHVTKIRTRRVASARRAKPRALRAADTSAQAGSTSDVGPVAALIGLLVVISAAAYARVRRSRRRERERRRRERRLRASRTA
jgi:hypothetical protein